MKQIKNLKYLKLEPVGNLPDLFYTKASNYLEIWFDLVKNKNLLLDLKYQQNCLKKVFFLIRRFTFRLIVNLGNVCVFSPNALDKFSCMQLRHH